MAVSRSIARMAPSLAALFTIGVSVLAAQTRQPKTVRELFIALPAKYFSLDCCVTIRDRRKAMEKYLATYLEVEDTANGYMKGGADAAQEGFEMALFKRPDGSYLIGLNTFGEGGLEDTPWLVFIDYRAGRWIDVSRQVIPEYSPATLEYILPRKGTTIEVYKKVEEGDQPKLYSLTWKDSKFVKTN